MKIAIERVRCLFADVRSVIEYERQIMDIISRLPSALLLSLLTVICIFNAAVSAAQTPREKYPEAYTMSPLGVNLQTGTFVYSKEDFRIGSLPFVRSWRAHPAMVATDNNDPHNFGAWTHNYIFGVVTADEYPIGLFADIYVDSVKFRHGHITTNTWQPYDQGSVGTLLTQSGHGSFVFTNKNGDAFHFSQARADYVDYADGQRIIFGYDGSGRLRTVLSNKGDAIVIDYINGRISAACGYNLSLHIVTLFTTCTSDSPEVKVSYGYSQINGRWRLTSILDANGIFSSMEYDAWQDPNLKCVRTPSTSPCEITNTYGTHFPDRVSQQVTGTGEIWKYEYSIDGNFDGPPQQPGQTWYTYAGMVDPEGFHSYLRYINGFVDFAVLKDGAVRYEWYGTALKKLISPMGNERVLDWDLRQNIVSDVRRATTGSGEPDIATTYVYPASNSGGIYGPSGCATVNPRVCNRPLSMTDPRGGTTDYTYDATHGGVLTETGPAVAGVRPQTRYTYAQRYAWISSGGGYVQAVTPIWLLAQKSFCKSGPASGAGCAIAGDEVVTIYDYGPDAGPNTLLLRGVVEDATGQTVRTCYGYDALGRRISETKPNAGFSSCP